MTTTCLGLGVGLLEALVLGALVFGLLAGGTIAGLLLKWARQDGGPKARPGDTGGAREAADDGKQADRTHG